MIIYSSATNAMNIILAVVREVIILWQSQQRNRTTMGKTYENIAYVLDI